MYSQLYDLGCPRVCTYVEVTYLIAFLWDMEGATHLTRPFLAGCVGGSGHKIIVNLEILACE